MSDFKKDSLERLFKIQADFSDLFFDKSSLSLEEREELTKSFALALHQEVSSLIKEINFRDHVHHRKNVVRSSLLYEGVDVFRYLLAIMNLWGFTTEEFTGAFDDKESYLRIRNELQIKEWTGQPVVLFDMDDVLLQFREPFGEWLNKEKDANVDLDSTEYYLLQSLSAKGMSSEGLLEEFIESGHLRSLPEISGAIRAANRLADEGFWVQVVTSRPRSNRKCRYDTHTWLRQSGMNFHGIEMNPEKMIWLSKMPFYTQGSVVCAVEDSAKHAMEYVKHGVPVVAPIKTYNQELHDLDAVSLYDDINDTDRIFDHVMNLYGQTKKTQGT